MYLKNKIIYLIVFIFLFSLFLPVLNSYSFNSENLYVWSNNLTPINETNITSAIVSETNTTSESTR